MWHFIQVPCNSAVKNLNWVKEKKKGGESPIVILLEVNFWMKHYARIKQLNTTWHIWCALLKYSYSRQVAATEWVWRCCRQLWWCEDETAQIHSHVYRGPVFFTSIGQIQFVKTLLRLTYEAAVNGNHISMIGHPIILFVQTHIGG